MATTNFTDNSTVIQASWLNEVDSLVYDVFGGLSDAGVDGKILVSDGSKYVEESGATARASLGAAARGANSDITSITGLTTDLTVAQGGTGASTFTDGAVLLGSGTGAITALDVTAKGSLLVGDGTTDPVALAVGTNDHILTADSSTTSGTKWAAVPSGARSVTGGNIFITESAAASSDIAGDGQIWVDDAVPNTLMFTNDAGADQTVHTTTTLPASQYQQVAGTVVATTSGTTKDFTSIPAGVKEITLMLDGMSANGTSDYLLQIGDSGGIEASGYACVANNKFDGTTPSATSGFVISVDVAAATLSHGFVTIKLLDASTFTWVAAGNIHQTGQALTSMAGAKSLSAELTQVRLTSVSPDTFDAGKINIHYSF
jgi:hypothetical protein